jgi:UTP--glucose-1-phosphate uridylyltransferase
MLPATRAVPKELLPVGRQPAIQWAVDEALDAGVDRIVIISSPLKLAIDAYFLNDNDSTNAGSQQHLASGCHIQIVHQHVARGLGDAVRIARMAIGVEPFAVLLPDEILLGGARLLRVMLDDFERTGQSGVSLLQVGRDEIGSYGCAAVAPAPPGGERVLVTGCVEKPQPFAAPSCLALSGRYVLGNDVLDLLDDVAPDERGEVQLTRALDRAGARGRLAGFEVRDEDGRIDVGNWQGWFDANVRLFSNEDVVDNALADVLGGGR